MFIEFYYIYILLLADVEYLTFANIVIVFILL